MSRKVGTTIVTIEARDQRAAAAAAGYRAGLLLRLWTQLRVRRARRAGEEFQQEMDRLVAALDMNRQQIAEAAAALRRLLTKNRAP